MSAEAAASEPESWKIVLPCTRAEAEALTADADPFADMDEPPVLNAREPDPACPDAWLLEAYVGHAPDEALIAAVAALAPSTGAAPRVEAIGPRDWVTLSQAGFAPVRAGRFFVHTAAHAGAVPAEATAFRIEAGRAFGTGHHATTSACLAMLDRLENVGAGFANILDVGTGTGLLAFAALALWPAARALATDIDPVAIEVARENAAANAVLLGDGAGELALHVADGLDHGAVAARARFDLVIANILAEPLTGLAPAIARATATGGTLILAGLLDRQEDELVAAYAAAGFDFADRIDAGGWPALLLRRR